MRKTFFFIIFTLFSFSWLCIAETAYEEGINLFRYNKPLEAKVKFETALLKDSSNEMIYYYLGMIYEQLEDRSKAIEMYRNGLIVAKTIKDVLYCHIGNNYFVLGKYTLAEKNYTLCIAENSAYAQAYLARANSNVNLKNFQQAIDDYKTYLQLKPNTEQREDIEKLIALLEKGITEDTDLLDNVINNLNNASLDTETISVDTEEDKDLREDIEIEE